MGLSRGQLPCFYNKQRRGWGEKEEFAGRGGNRAKRKLRCKNPKTINRPHWKTQSIEQLFRKKFYNNQNNFNIYRILDNIKDIFLIINSYYETMSFLRGIVKYLVIQ